MTANLSSTSAGVTGLMTRARSIGVSLEGPATDGWAGANWRRTPIAVGSCSLGGTSAAPGGQVDAQPLRHAIDPVRRPERPPARQRGPHGGQFGLVLRRFHLGPPSPPPLR